MNCRLCLADCFIENAVPLFTRRNNLNLTELIDKYLYVEVQPDDSYSTIICSNCFANLENFHEFFDTVELRQDQLANKKKQTEHSETNKVHHSDEHVEIKQEVSEEQMISETNQDVCLIMSEKYEEETFKVLNEAANHNESFTDFKMETSDNKDISPINKEKPQCTCKVKEEQWNAKFSKFVCHIFNEELQLNKLSTEPYKRRNKQGLSYVYCCGTRFYQKNIFFEHILTHYERRLFVCRHCSMDCKSSNLLRIHMSKVHKLSDFEFSCQKCDRKFKKIAELGRHLSEHDEEISTILKDVLQIAVILLSHTEKEHERRHEFYCEFCAQEFNDEITLELHREQHSKQFDKIICPICQNWFVNIKHHMEDAHKETNLTQLICVHCKRPFKTTNSLKAHIAIIHITKSCVFCKETFADNNMRREHIAHLHKNEMWTCFLCNKKFKNAWTINGHCRKHHSFNILHCPHCNRGFKTKTVMDKHISDKHPAEWAKAELAWLRAKTNC